MYNVHFIQNNKIVKTLKFDFNIFACKSSSDLLNCCKNSFYMQHDIEANDFQEIKLYIWYVCDLLELKKVNVLLETEIINERFVKSNHSYNHIFQITEKDRHVWKADDSGNIDNFVLEFNEHRGPKCIKCDLEACVICTPSFLSSNCKK